MDPGLTLIWGCVPSLQGRLVGCAAQALPGKYLQSLLACNVNRLCPLVILRTIMVMQSISDVSGSTHS